MSSRHRNRSHRHPSGERFCLIPLKVLESPAWKAIPDYARSVLIAISAQYYGINNGNLSLTVETAKELGISPAWKRTAGIALLIKTGLIIETRQASYPRRSGESSGRRGRGLCALYAITWVALNKTDKAYPPIILDTPASNKWREWELTSDWPEIEKLIRKRAQGSRNRKISFIKDGVYQANTDNCNELTVIIKRRM